MLDRDLLNNVNPRAVAQATMGTIDGVQQFRPADQVAGMASAFILMCEHYGIEPQDAFTVCSNVMRGEDGRRPEFAAVAMYMEHEL